MKAVVTFILIFFSLCNIAQQVPSDIAPAIHFTENKGQWTEQVLYKATLDQATIYLEKNCITFDLANTEDLTHLHHPSHKEDTSFNGIVRKHCYKLWFEGCNAQPSVEKNIQSRSYNNYFIGNDENKWASKVYSYAEIIYKELYPGIDLKVYSRGNNFKYDFIVHPGADISNIKLRYEGLDGMYEVNNTLQLSASFAKITESEPVAYVQTEYYTLPVQCKYVLHDNILSFYIPQLYDKNYPLIIDPELVFASYTGSSQDNWGYTATYDLDGNLYGGGITFGSGYPTTTGTYQVSFGGGDPGDPPYDFDPYDNGLDISISKFSPDGTSLIYSTYLGGDGNELPHSLIVNSEGELLVYGTTGSEDFPVTASAYDVTFNGGGSVSVEDGVITFPDGVDIIVSKFSADGSSLDGSTYIGGSGSDGLNLASATFFNYGDFARGEVIVDESDNVFVASSTYSSDFPVTSGAFQTSIAGGQDACVFKFNSSLSSLSWSTFVGGSNSDGAYSLKRNSSGEVIVGGGTNSSNFPVTSGTWHSSIQGGTDGWVAKLNASGTSLLAGSFVGTSSYDQVYFVEKDDDDYIYFTGQTKGSYYVSPGAYSETNGRQFITKINSALTTVDYSMVFGSGGSSIDISPSAFLVDDCQNVYVSGWGGNVNVEGSTSGMSITPDAIQSTTDGSDFYFFVLQKDAADILFGSYFGGYNTLAGEHVDGGTSRFDKGGTIYQGVCAGCGGEDDFPVTPGVWSETNGSSNCNLGVAKIKLDLAGVYAISEAEPSISGCAPFTVLFDNLSSDAEEYIWDFGDGTASSTLFEPTHTFTDPGTYTVELVVIDSTTCNIADTAYLTIEVSNGNIIPDIEYEIEQNCDSLVLTITNNSVGYDATEYFWSFGDGTTSTLEEPEHIYTIPGTYLVQFVISDSTSCNKFDTIEFEINYLNDFNTGYEITTDGCLPVTATFHADFDGAEEYFWDLGDGTTATTQDVVHDYFTPGTYTITLSITYCGYTDVYTDFFTVYELPTAFFDPEPSFGIANAPTTFVNLSENAATYLWEFSDGTFSTEENPVKYFPGQGTFEVCLTAYNLAGCPDTYCRNISIENAGAADIPSGFSPNGDGANDVLFVKGFGFANMHLQVFNRWGQLVFETFSQKDGWDGTLRNKPLDMDVFVYNLIVDFTDGKHFEKTGNVTLIR